MIIWNPISPCKLLGLNKNTWNCIIECKLLVFSIVTGRLFTNDYLIFFLKCPGYNLLVACLGFIAYQTL